MQRIWIGHSFPWFLDSFLCIGVIFHGVIMSKPDFNSLVTFPMILGQELRLNVVYALAGYFSFLSGLTFVPYMVFYAMAVIGFISVACNIVKGRNGFGNRKHSHRH